MPSPAPVTASTPVPVVLNVGARRGAGAAAELRRLLEARLDGRSDGQSDDRTGGRALELGDVVEVSSGAELLEALDRAVATAPPPLVVAGGDGTLCAAADRVAGTGTVLGVLPAGTANDFARTLELDSMSTAVEALVTGRVVDVDLGRVETLTRGDGGGDARPDAQAFLNVASCGLSSVVTEMLSPRLKRHLGPLAYPVATLRAYRRHVDFSAVLEFPDGDHDTLRLDHVLQVSVGNGRHYGGGRTVAPGASVDDGALDVSVIVRGSLRDHATWARRLRDGSVVEHERVVHLTSRRVRLTTDTPRPLNLDGEPALATPVELSVDRNALHVVIPATGQAAVRDA
ncbi:YegS/Rv2252/BmrU family lipid kinase [Nocardioides sp. HDW12B]|uniref:diacylglycerol/lipid kinase family protein n=1 Tax=Nocardioides sp. HDW12B TaxID=2714939 RepID=UPI001409C17E|nr:YegS/Rv2252/BmrU family lipid kinase [Nocardioides sp. HDW12B]QIK66347.1 YegS/Rv2252/BmrU family lipid kinase [Nocardioides sp. HDW12B]